MSRKKIVLHQSSKQQNNVYLEQLTSENTQFFKLQIIYPLTLAQLRRKQKIGLQARNALVSIQLSLVQYGAIFSFVQSGMRPLFLGKFIEINTHVKQYKFKHAKYCTVVGEHIGGGEEDTISGQQPSRLNWPKSLRGHRNEESSR